MRLKHQPIAKLQTNSIQNDNIKEDRYHSSFVHLC